VAAHGPTPTEREDAVTPELALVDPALARDARVQLPPPDDTLARLGALVEASRMASLARCSLETPRPPVEALVDSVRRDARIGSRRSVALAGGVAAGTLVIALLVGVRIDVRGTPAAADITISDEVPPSSPIAPRTGVGTPATSGRSERPGSAGPPPRTAAPTSQRFAWAPTPGASAYHVELFRGPSKVFEADTKHPAMTIPARWVFDRRRQSLEPGTYRWYVWPLVLGKRASRAIVQSSLVVPTR